MFCTFFWYFFNTNATCHKLGEAWRSLAKLGERSKPEPDSEPEPEPEPEPKPKTEPELEPEPEPEPELEAWRSLACFAVLASGVSHLAKPVFFIVLQRQCKI
jgi:hypothetical protein